MKIFISTVLVSLSLLARTNPFESTDTFEEKKNRLLAEQLQKENITNKKPIKEDLQKKVYTSKKGCKDNYIYDILPFIKVTTTPNSLNLSIKQKYTLLNQDIDQENKKLIFDFKGKTNFYTKREVLCHKYFKTFAIGCHKKKNYFRIVIDLKEDVLNYKDIIDTKKNNLQIQYIK
ncbi:MAG: AMIN domain-containing protein [Campylobacterota bacterium]|nr:AMIN domain-containing protein [Campylobacterota bacterium]